MNNVKPVKSLRLSILISLQVNVLIGEEENGNMYQILYASKKFDDCDWRFMRFGREEIYLTLCLE